MIPVPSHQANQGLASLGQWKTKQDAGEEERKWRGVIDIVHAGRDRVAKAKLERDAAEAAKAGQPIAIDGEIA